MANKRGRPRKYATPEEAKAARKKQNADFAKQRLEQLKAWSTLRKGEGTEEMLNIIVKDLQQIIVKLGGKVEGE